jgi:hypothetical protein
VALFSSSCFLSVLAEVFVAGGFFFKCLPPSVRG